MTLFTVINRKYWKEEARDEDRRKLNTLEIFYKHFEYALTVITTQGIFYSQ